VVVISDHGNLCIDYVASYAGHRAGQSFYVYVYIYIIITSLMTLFYVRDRQAGIHTVKRLVLTLKMILRGSKRACQQSLLGIQ
jgi:hypothetical protein